MRFVSRSVMTGFVNALAILIFLAQLPELDPSVVGPLTYALVAAGLAIIYLFPLLTKAVPSPLVTIVVLTALTLAVRLGRAHRGRHGRAARHAAGVPAPRHAPDPRDAADHLPLLGRRGGGGAPREPDDAAASSTTSPTRAPDRDQRVHRARASPTLATGFIGGMAGCAMIGQSMINVKSGGRGRLSCFIAGVFLLILVVGLGDWVSLIPMPALVAIMIMVSIGTFSWSSITALRTHPALLLGGDAGDGRARWSGPTTSPSACCVGVLLSGIFFAGKIAQLFRVTSTLSAGRARADLPGRGPALLRLAEGFMRAFDFGEALERVVIDVSGAHIWDISSVAALDMAVLKFRRDGAEVEIVGMNEASETIVDRLGSTTSRAPSTSSWRIEGGRHP